MVLTTARDCRVLALFSWQSATPQAQALHQRDTKDNDKKPTELKITSSQKPEATNEEREWVCCCFAGGGLFLSRGLATLEFAMSVCRSVCQKQNASIISLFRSCPCRSVGWSVKNKMRALSRYSAPAHPSATGWSVYGFVLDVVDCSVWNLVQLLSLARIVGAVRLVLLFWSHPLCF